MKITVNDNSKDVPAELTIAQLLEHEKVKMPAMVSVQVNGAIVERGAFATTRLRENDSVDFLYFMGGGGRAR